MEGGKRWTDLHAPVIELDDPDAAGGGQQAATLGNGNMAEVGRALWRGDMRGVDPAPF